MTKRWVQKREDKRPIVVWGEPSVEIYCTLHEDYEPTCPTCRWAKRALELRQLKKRKADTSTAEHPK